MNIDEKLLIYCVIFIAYIWKMAYRNTNNPFDRVVSDIINIITIFLCKKIKRNIGRETIKFAQTSAQNKRKSYGGRPRSFHIRFFIVNISDK